MSSYSQSVAKLLMPEEAYLRMLRNAREIEENPAADHVPVVKLHIPVIPEGHRPVWLLTEINPDDDDIAFGLCDLGMGFPELGYVSITELVSVRNRAGLPMVEREEPFDPSHPISVYVEAARMCQQITEDPDKLAIAQRSLLRKPR